MLKLGIIGAGRIGQVHATSITNNVKNASVHMIADPFMNEDKIKWINELGIENITTDYKEILENKDIDAVLICSSTDTHSSISIEAARANKHIFCEKPIDHDLAKIQMVLEEVEKAGIKYQVGFNRRFDNNFKAIKDAVTEGKIGTPHIIKVTSRDPEAPGIDYVKVSGGMFLDMTIHDFDMVRYLSESEVEEVYALGGVLVNPEIGEAGDIDTAIITLKLKNGALGVIDNSREAAYGYDQRAEVFGSLGSVAISNDSGSKAVISTKDGIVSEKPLYFFLERYMQSFGEEVNQFVEAIVNDKNVPVNANDGLQPVLIGLAAKKSLEEKRPVKISEIF
ncbi:MULTISPECIES: inositol 2-dehydrogenase [Psychrilyobacter]|uniref:Inositol 2-dehydrogenase n=1 Tax=Psychrilyobacter piezotolerans TaxID=2293438 RepID=A0ABX9KHE9_9FUSO|nr:MULTISPECIES: inositol 2-dehydrogenase [Psychrilyobacter]MCS5421983.1 inositol 2-dehydrogenase [Psychrilyobacter sp. S5]NDI77717.1 inositol 2-dehydrogenase [Psychrilyobacter piezotolerans]RDE61416.1 inositol 2-dehydrogenase [Psychrilyobacter sp. S5]REI40937.1 inositol 2-dehydrogenase [Psychrilyobacter piezotolerans]